MYVRMPFSAYESARSYANRNHKQSSASVYIDHLHLQEKKCPQPCVMTSELVKHTLLLLSCRPKTSVSMSRALSLG